MSSEQGARILLVRHGRTALNAEDRIRGLADPELDEVGIAQARATAQALLPFHVKHVISSPLQRAVSTAEIIADATGASHTVDDSFNDRDYGSWTGHLRSEVLEEWGSIDAAPGVEPEETVRGRVLPALNSLLPLAETGTTVVVTHDAVIRPLLDAIQPGIQVTVPNGSWAELRYLSGEWAVVSVDNSAGE